MALGAAIILLFGATHLAIVHPGGVEGALRMGVVPFLPGDAVKLAVACAIWRGSRDRVQTIFG
jgi:biotin transporter BioY